MSNVSKQNNASEQYLVLIRKKVIRVLFLFENNMAASVKKIV